MNEILEDRSIEGNKSIEGNNLEELFKEVKGKNPGKCIIIQKILTRSGNYTFIVKPGS